MPKDERGSTRAIHRRCLAFGLQLNNVISANEEIKNMDLTSWENLRKTLRGEVSRLEDEFFNLNSYEAQYQELIQSCMGVAAVCMFIVEKSKRDLKKRQIPEDDEEHAE